MDLSFFSENASGTTFELPPHKACTPKFPFNQFTWKKAIESAIGQYGNLWYLYLHLHIYIYIYIHLYIYIYIYTALHILHQAVMAIFGWSLQFDGNCSAGLSSMAPVAQTYYSWGFPKNKGTPKSSISRGCPIIYHPFGGTPMYGNPQL